MNVQTPNQSNQVVEVLNYVSNTSKNAINTIISFILSGSRNKLLAELKLTANAVHALRPKMMSLSDEKLKNRTTLLKSRLEQGKSLDDILIEAFATIREAARRVLNEEHYLVQLMGGAALHKGMITEMKTGEGKTLVAILPAYLNALLGLGVHIVTVNDYLAKRDAEWMGQVFEFLGLKVGYVISSMQQCDKKASYDSDITYCTNNELGFDFLRDNMINDASERCQRGLNFCIVDEADSVLIDEARTPLIISGPTNDTSDGYMLANAVVIRLTQDHYEINLKEHQANFTDAGIDATETILIEAKVLDEGEPLYSAKHSVLLHQLSQALKAHHLYRLGIDYIIENDSDGNQEKPAIKIIDEHTGRTLHGRRYSDGLHQALEAKEYVPIRPESETLASITFQRLFRMYTKLSGMTGTAMTEAEEFEKTYRLKCIDMPTNLPRQRIDHDDLIYMTKYEKIRAIVGLVAECHSRGQPVIIGTTNVESSEELYEILHRSHFNLNVLNAKNHAREADIIANAGRYGAITVVTNIAGRGTDIKLGGDVKVLLKRHNFTEPEEIAREEARIHMEVEENKREVIKAGGLFVIGVEHNNNRRIDNQLRGRSGRQGDPGASKFFMCTDDDLIRKFNPNMAGMLKQFGARDDEVLEHPWLTTAVSTAQKRMEAYNFEVRQSLQKYADIKESYIIKLYDKRNRVLDSDVLEDLIYLFEFTLKNPSDLEKLQTLLSESGNESTNVFANENDLRLEFYSKVRHYKDTYKEYAQRYIRKIMVNAIDLNCRRYMVLMNNARDFVAFQAYTQRDPIMVYYNIARDKFNEIMINSELEYVVNFLKEEREEPSYEDFWKPFESLKDYLRTTFESIDPNQSKEEEDVRNLFDGLQENKVQEDTEDSEEGEGLDEDGDEMEENDDDLDEEDEDDESDENDESGEDKLNESRNELRKSGKDEFNESPDKEARRMNDDSAPKSKSKDSGSTNNSKDSGDSKNPNSRETAKKPIIEEESDSDK